MPAGTGVDIFGKAFPDRTFDVGIAEQHAVTFAAGLASEGMKPFAAIYSTFLQRGYDQVVHDVAIQNLPVRFAIDRAGLVGADGPTHAGSFDIAYLGCLPNMVVMAAGDEAELVHMVATAAAIDDRPSAFRYPRGEGLGVEMPTEGKPLEIGKGRILREGNTVALLSFGTRLGEALKAADHLAAHGLSTTVADARFAKPLDIDLVMRLAREHELLVTIEEGSIGGFGSYVVQALAERDLHRQRPQGPHHGAAGYLHGSGQARQNVCQGRPRRGRHRRAGDERARQAHRAHGRRQGRLTMKEDTKKSMKVILAQPRGFCAGVVRAIEIVERALEKYGPPVYVRHEIVHNKHVVESSEGQGRALRRESLGDSGRRGHDLLGAWRGKERRRRGGAIASSRCWTRPVRW